MTSEGSPGPAYDLALVLSGGGARGFAHIGVLDVIEALLLPIDLLVGVSMGAIIAACYAAGLAPGQMIELARAMRVGTIFRPRPGRLQLVDAAGIRAAVTEIFGELRFADLQRELAVVSSSVTTGEHFVIREGPIVDALVASCSIPLVFPPVDFDGHHLVDGGLIDGMPIGVARSLGAQRIVAVDASTHSRKLLRLPGVRHAARGMVTILGHRERRRAAVNGETVDAVRIFTQVLDRATQPLTRPPVEVLIRPPFGRRTMFDYHRWPEMVACGRLAGEAARPALAALAAAPAIPEASAPATAAPDCIGAHPAPPAGDGSARPRPAPPRPAPPRPRAGEGAGG